MLQARAHRGKFADIYENNILALRCVFEHEGVIACVAGIQQHHLCNLGEILCKFRVDEDVAVELKE